RRGSRAVRPDGVVRQMPPRPARWGWGCVSARVLLGVAISTSPCSVVFCYYSLCCPSCQEEGDGTRVRAVLRARAGGRGARRAMDAADPAGPVRRTGQVLRTQVRPARDRRDHAHGTLARPGGLRRGVALT